MFTLVIEQEGVTPKYVPIDAGTMRIGRDPECEVVLVSQFVSRTHAELRMTESGLELVDLGSRNGTELHGRRVPADTPQPLRSGDAFMIENFTLRLMDDDASTQTMQRVLRHEDELYVDTQAMEVWIGERQLKLRQARVLKLLAYLYTNRGRVCSEEELGNHVWAGDVVPVPGVPLFDSASLHQLIYLARRAIEPGPEPRYLINVPGLGYRLDPRPQTA